MPEKSTEFLGDYVCQDTTPTRVLIYTTAFRPFIGGSEIALEENVRHLPNILFDIFTPRYSRKLKSNERFDNFCLHRVGLGFPFDKYLFPLLGFFASLPKMRKVKILHAYQASFGGMAAWLIKVFFPNKKLIVTLQEGKDLDRQNAPVRIIRNLILKKADVITTISLYLKNYASSVNKDVEIKIIPNGVGSEYFRSNNTGRDPHTVITVSRLVEKNGIAHLIKAMKKVRGKIPDSKLIIVGSGHEEKLLKQLTHNLGLEGCIEFEGEAPYADIPRYLAKASIFVRPSLSEGLGSAFLEAMAAGVAIIGTSVGGIPDFLKDGETGLFCKPGDSDSVADKIIEIMEDDSLRQRLIENGRKLVEENYTWDKIAKKFEDVYSRI